MYVCMYVCISRLGKAAYLRSGVRAFIWNASRVRYAALWRLRLSTARGRCQGVVWRALNTRGSVCAAHLVDMAIIMYRDNHQDPHKYGDYGGPLLAGDVPFISYIVKKYFLFM